LPKEKIAGLEPNFTIRNNMKNVKKKKKTKKKSKKPKKVKVRKHAKKS
ncbi:hypothetical protein MNBD_GAMMA04-2042, partial [hydrothermal vent metagenome]